MANNVSWVECPIFAILIEVVLLSIVTKPSIEDLEKVDQLRVGGFHAEAASFPLQNFSFFQNILLVRIQ